MENRRFLVPDGYLKIWLSMCIRGRIAGSFCGDTAQLPPVGLDISPALSKQELEFYDREVFEYELTDVVRQNQNSGILYNATMIRNLITSGDFYSGYFHLNVKV